MKKALIFGITGQDGSYLAEFLLEKGYSVKGVLRRSSIDNTWRIKDIINKKNFSLVYGDLSDSLSITNIISNYKPDEIYNLAAQSDVKISFEIPEYTSNINALGTLRIIEAVRILKLEKKTRIYQASTSELYGKIVEQKQNENTPFHPYSPYGIAKLYAYWICKEYREAYNMFIVNGIMFNHESERRGEEFVTRKITKAVARIKYNLQEKLELGNIDSLRDWGYAKDYIECMWLALQKEYPDDYVVATGTQHSVREFTTLAFKYAGIEIQWTGKGLNEKGIDKKTNKIVVSINKDFYRPTEVSSLLGDSKKAMKELNWNPNKTSFEKLVEIMVKNDIKIIEKEMRI